MDFYDRFIPRVCVCVCRPAAFPAFHPRAIHERADDDDVADHCATRSRRDAGSSALIVID